MKKLAAILILICVALSSFPAAVVFGAEKYPDNASFEKHAQISGLADYAVGEGQYAFLAGGKITVLTYSSSGTYEKGSRAVTDAEGADALDCSGGEFYYRLSDGAHKLSGELAEGVSGFGEENTVILSDGSFYRLGGEGKLVCLLHDSDSSSEIGTGYSKLKVYGDRAYALKDGELYLFEGSSPAKLTGEDGKLTYMDYTETGEISAEGALGDVKAATLKFVTLKAGAYYSEIDLNGLTASSETLDVDYNKTYLAKGGEAALLICYTGADDKTAIISIGRTSYVLLADNVDSARSEEIELSATFAAESDHASIIESDAYIYSAPFASVATRIAAPEAGKQLQVIRKVASPANFGGLLALDFYEVSYSVREGETVKGFIPAGFLLTGMDFVNDDNPQTVRDENYSESDVVRTAVLIIIAVALALVACGYVAYIATADKRRKRAGTPTSAHEPTPPDNNS